MDFSFVSEGGYSGTFSSFQSPDWLRVLRAPLLPPLLLFCPAQVGSSGYIATSSSTPFGTRNVTVSGTDGFVSGAVTFKMGIGDFSLSLSPSTIVVGPSGAVTPNLTSASTYGLKETLTVGCSGLPAQATCVQNGGMNTNGGIDGLTVGTANWPRTTTPSRSSGRPTSSPTLSMPFYRWVTLPQPSTKPRPRFPGGNRLPSM